jgi:hypothetical protein
MLGFSVVGVCESNWGNIDVVRSGVDVGKFQQGNSCRRSEILQVQLQDVLSPTSMQKERPKVSSVLSEQ